MPVKKVVIIDDDLKNIFALSAVLRANGFNIIDASNVMRPGTVKIR